MARVGLPPRPQTSSPGVRRPKVASRKRCVVGSRFLAAPSDGRSVAGARHLARIAACNGGESSSGRRECALGTMDRGDHRGVGCATRGLPWRTRAKSERADWSRSAWRVLPARVNSTCVHEQRHRRRSRLGLHHDVTNVLDAEIPNIRTFLRRSMCDQSKYSMKRNCSMYFLFIWIITDVHHVLLLLQIGLVYNYTRMLRRMEKIHCYWYAW